MKIEDSLKQNLLSILNSSGFNDFSLNDIEVIVNKDKTHGDYSSNLALKFSKKVNKNPREFANLIVSNFKSDDIEKLEIAGPGFINFFVKNNSISKVIDEVLTKKESYGNLDKKNITYNIEYVSANPTGDLHLGHARGAALGDSISRILKKAGYNVIREYYINDAGAQVNNLAKSLKSRYLELFNIKYEIPEDGYQGEDVIKIAKEFKELYGDKFVEIDDKNLNVFRDFGIKKELEKIKNDLKEFRVEFDVFTSETDIRHKYDLNKLINDLSKYCYKQDGALYLRTTDFLDDKDRPLIKSNGDYTYFLPDIIYHFDKIKRNADFLIDVLGSDHHGYVNRLKSALMMLGFSKDILEVEMTQMVRIIKDGEEVKMSKRLGNAIKMRDLVNMVGVDACRYFFVSRSSNSHLDFDLGVALATNSSNPVYYAQYAYARISRVLSTSDIELNNNYELLDKDLEIDLMKTLTNYDKIISDASKERAPYKICNYIQELASKIHEYYAKFKFSDENQKLLSGARMSLLKACSIVLKDALNLVGVSAPNEM